MLAEFSLGRAFQLNTVGAIDKIKPNSFWRYTGILGIITSIGILSFYGVIAAGLSDIFLNHLRLHRMKVLRASANLSVILFMKYFHSHFFIFLTTLIVYKGVEAGIEKWSKILMPLLLILLIILIVYANLLPGSEKDWNFIFCPILAKSL